MKIEMTEVRKLSEKKEWLRKFTIAYHGFDRGGYRVCEGARFLQTYIDGKPAGFVMLEDFTPNFSEFVSHEVWNLNLMYVKPEFRHRGLCEAMIKWTLENHNVLMIELTEHRVRSNSDFYFNLGFRHWLPMYKENLGYAIQGTLRKIIEARNRSKGFVGLGDAFEIRPTQTMRQAA